MGTVRVHAPAVWLVGPAFVVVGLVLLDSGCVELGCSLPWLSTPPTVVMATDQYVLHRGPGSSAQASLRVAVVEGRRPFSYRWSVTDPAGNVAGELLKHSDGSSAVLTPGALDGPYEVSCLVEDACGRTSRARTLLSVGSSVGLDISTERVGVVAGGGPAGRTTVRVNPSSGVPPFDIVWTCTGPDGRIDNDRLDTSDPLAPVFTSSDLVGVYVLTGLITDAWGDTSVESVTVVVGQILGLDVIAARATVLPGGGASGMVTLLATPIGGVEPYAYDWEVIDPEGNTRSDLLWDTQVRSPVFESPDEGGVYVARCAVTDGDGTVLIGSTTIVVGQQISVDARASRLVLPSVASAESTARLTADVRGGRDPVEVVWEVVRPDGGDGSSLLETQEGLETSLFSGGDPGSYVVRCTATDADGLSSTDSLLITVGGVVGLTITASRTSLAAGGIGAYGTATLSAQPHGGEPPYSYAWSVLDPFGRQATHLLSDPTDDGPTFRSSTTVGLHHVMCTVTDAAGGVAVDSIGIGIGQPLNVDVTVDKQSLIAGGGVGGQAQIVTTLNGGVAPFTHYWTVIDPNGVSGTARLSSTSLVVPVFTSTAATGTYSLTLTTTDAAGVVFVDSVEIVVGGEAASGQDLSLDAATNRQTVAPSGGTASLTATVSGGVAPITYSWQITDPAGTVDNTRLDSTVSATPTFTSGTTQGTYRAVCTVVDGVGNTFTDSVQLTVTDGFTVDLSADVTHVSPGGTVNLLADRTGGEANFTYTWSCVDDGGGAAGTFGTGSTGVGAALQISADDANNTWTAPTAAVGALGTYRISVVVTETNGRNFTDSVMVSVTNAFLIDVSASAVSVAPGGSANLTADRTGGSPNFTFTWSCVDGSSAAAGTFTTGATGTGAATQTGADDVTNVWTAPAAGAGTLGTYRLTVQATEASGVSFEDTIHIMVADPFSVDVTAADPAVPPAGSTTLTANRTGGETTFTYVWTARDSAGALAGSFTAGSTGLGEATQSAQADDATNTWTAPAAGGGSTDACTITCTATDSRGSTFTDSVVVSVGDETAFTLDVAADITFIAPAGVVKLNVDQTGGSTPYDYAFAAVDESGAAAGTLGVASQTDVAGDTTNTWTAPAAGSGTLGTYRLSVTATDDAGGTFTDSVSVIVRSPLALNVAASSIYVEPSTVVNLVADQTGGEPNYQYVWTAKDSAGAAGGTFGTGSTGVGAATQSGEAGDATNTWSTSTEGSYTLTCTVTGNTGQVFTDTVSIIVTSQDVFSLDITADKHVVAPGEVTSLIGDRTGGLANFSYAWTATNEGGASAGTLGTATQTGVANDTTNTWTAPTGTGVEGTYRISCLLTDASGRVFTDSLLIEVSSLALQNVFLAPPAASTNSVHAGTTLTVWSTMADPGQQITAALTNPVYPRNVVITISDADNSITGGTARVTGINARGLAQSEVISIAASAGASSTNTGVVPFATVTQIDLFAFLGADAGVDQVYVGVGTKFGLSGLLEVAGDVVYVLEDGSLMTVGYTVDATVGQQGITFANAPNGARNYTVVFRAR